MFLKIFSANVTTFYYVLSLLNFFSYSKKIAKEAYKKIFSNVITFFGTLTVVIYNQIFPYLMYCFLDFV